MRNNALVSSLPVISFVGLVALGCSDASNPLTPDMIAERFDPIVGGIEDTGSTNNNVVAVLAIDPATSKAEGLCTGSLIAPNVVLTARHCVSKTSEYVTCGQDVTSDYAPNWFSIMIGPKPTSIYSFVKEVVHYDSKVLCGQDIALLVTTANIKSAPPLKVRVHTGTKQGELFRAIGYGLTNPYDENSSGERYYRDNVRVKGLHPDTSNDFVGTQSICQGDSGGPAISKQGAVFGVTSRGGGCYGDYNTWTRTDPHKALIDHAIKLANASYTGEDGTVYNESSGGSGGSGGSSGSGGSGGSSGTGGTGGSSGSGGNSGTGGTGGSSGSGGSSGTGGSGGSSGAGGSGGTGGGGYGGSGGTGGDSGSGGYGGTGGTGATGGDSGSGGSSASGGSGGSSASGGSGGSNASGGSSGSSDDSYGEACGDDFTCPKNSVCVDHLGMFYCAPPCSKTNPKCPEYYTCDTAQGACFKSEKCNANGECGKDLVCVETDIRYCTVHCDSEGGCPFFYQCDTDLNTCFRSDNEGCGPNNACSDGRVCVHEPTKHCSVPCGENASCPEHTECNTDTQTCEPIDTSTTSKVSCAISIPSDDSIKHVWLLAAAASLLVAQRRRQKH